MTTAGTVAAPCPRCGNPMNVTVSAGPGLEVGDTYELLLHVDELDHPHFLTCTTDPHSYEGER